LIIAEPDVTTSGPAYFTTEENDAIKSFVENGGGPLRIREVKCKTARPAQARNH